MDFGWSQPQVELYDRILAFARSQLNGNVAERMERHEFGAKEWRACGDFGLLGLSVPESFGGQGLDMLTTALAVESFGRGAEDAGLVFSASAHLFACTMPIAENASTVLKHGYLPGLATGKLIGANAITEAGAGSDVFALATRAVRDGDHYVLDGVKSYVTNGPVADVGDINEGLEALGHDGLRSVTAAYAGGEQGREGAILAD